MYGEVKIVGRAMPMPFGFELGLKDSGVGEGELVYEMDEHVSAEAQAIETEAVYRPKIGNAREIAECVARIKNGSLSIESAAKICRVSCTTSRRRVAQARLKIRKLYNQLVFATDKSLQFIRFVCAEDVP